MLLRDRDRRGLEEARNVTAVFFDKTGTLTRGEFRVVKITARDGIGQDEALALAAAVERASDGHNDLLDRVGQPGLSDAEVLAIQQLLVDGGALDEIERLIERLTARAIDTISTADITPRARDELVDLARFVASRDA